MRLTFSRVLGPAIPGCVVRLPADHHASAAADIGDAAFDLFNHTGCARLLGASCRAEGIHAILSGMYRAWRRESSAALRSSPEWNQQGGKIFPKVYQRNGAVYLVTTEFFFRTGRLRSDNPLIYEMPWERSINIDVPGDLLDRQGFDRKRHGWGVGGAMKIVVTKRSILRRRSGRSWPRLAPSSMARSMSPTLRRQLADCDAMMVRLGCHFGKLLIAQASKLRYILAATTGLDHIDLDAARLAWVRGLSASATTARKSS